MYLNVVYNFFITGGCVTGKCDINMPGTVDRQ